tara:strand:+ start:536 stop:766 length:231 start_codon:yes stop_codon:yes gene_type:complete
MEEEQTFEEYMGEVTARLNTLSEEDKASLGEIAGTKMAKLLGFVLGPRVAALAGETGDAIEEEVLPPMKRGLAARI